MNKGRRDKAADSVVFRVVQALLFPVPGAVLPTQSGRSSLRRSKERPQSLLLLLGKITVKTVKKHLIVNNSQMVYGTRHVSEVCTIKIGVLSVPFLQDNNSGYKFSHIVYDTEPGTVRVEWEHGVSAFRASDVRGLRRRSFRDEV